MQSALSIEPHRLSSTNNHLIAAYSARRLSIADFSQGGTLIFERMEAFWEGGIEHVDFMDSKMLIKTSSAFYLCEVTQEHRILLRNYQLLIDPIYEFVVTGHNSEVIVVSKDLTKLRTMKVHCEGSSEKVPLTNELINPGGQCLGGYSDEKGCIVGNFNEQSAYNYSTQCYKIESLNSGMYHDSNAMFPDSKLKAFIKKNFIFPDR
jgi:hypothetical protein